MSNRPRLLSKFDTNATRAILITFILFLVILGIFLAGKFGGFGNFAEMQRALESFAASPWGVPFLIFIFCVSAFIGVPQFALIAAAVVAFGPLWGAIWSWVATLCSGTLTFWVGRFAGEETFRRYAGTTANRFSRFIGRNALAASAIVRNVPTGPFIVVNMAFGVMGASFLAFFIGMAIGIVPKIALVAFAGQGVMEAVTGNIWIAVAAVLVAALIWFALFKFSRGRLGTRRQTISEKPANLVDTSD